MCGSSGTSEFFFIEENIGNKMTRDKSSTIAISMVQGMVDEK
jgi:hypothetical protein